MKATASVKIGPISARFTGNVQLSDLDPPTGYTISGEGQGGVAGFAKGGAKVRLEDDGPDTTLRYEVHAQVGGKLAQLGARLIDATAKQLADQFFDRFSREVAPPQAVAAGPVPHPVIPPERAAPRSPPPSSVSMFALVPREPFGLPIAAWVGGVIYLAILLLFVGAIL